MKKIISLLLALIVICAALVSCSDDGAPDGMKSATVSGDPFILWVPENFTSNTESGISSAYYMSLENSVIVTARYYTPVEEMSLEEYMNKCAESYALRLEDFRKTSEVAADILGGEKASRLEYKMTKDEVVYTVIQRTAEWKGDFVSLNLYTTGNALEIFAEQITAIVDNFALADKGERSDVVLTDGNTPEGMRIASSDIVEYRFYAPMEWVCDPNSGVSEAHHPETLANVTVTSYSPDAEVKGMSTKDYVEYCVGEYEKAIGGFSEVESCEYKGKVAEKAAESLTFLVEYDGVSYKVRQVIFHAPEYDLYYSITYTAREADFDTHLADFEKMADSFCFRVLGK